MKISGSAHEYSYTLELSLNYEYGKESSVVGEKVRFIDAIGCCIIYS